MKSNKYNSKFLSKYNLQDPVCMYKWTWSTIRLMEGSTNSCHRVKSDKLTPENYENFHNTPTKLLHRKTMQKGQWPGDGCEYCRDIELAGGHHTTLLTRLILFAVPSLLVMPFRASPRMLPRRFSSLLQLFVDLWYKHHLHPCK